jgi:hypothetical protein
MVEVTGFEPATTRITIWGSTIELQPPIKLAERTGLEPATSNVTGWRSNQTELPLLKNGGGYRIRTDDILLAKQTLYH